MKKIYIGVSILIIALPSLMHAQVVPPPNNTPVDSVQSGLFTNPGSMAPPLPVSNNPPTAPLPSSNNPPQVAPLPSSNSPSSNTFFLQNPLDRRFDSVGGLVQGFLEILSYIVVLFAVLMLIWTGLQFILSQGKPEKMNELKERLLWIVVGVAIVIGARIIVSVVINTLSATGTVSPGVIQNANNALQGRNPGP